MGGTSKLGGRGGTSHELEQKRRRDVLSDSKEKNEPLLFFINLLFSYLTSTILNCCINQRERVGRDFLRKLASRWLAAQQRQNRTQSCGNKPKETGPKAYFDKAKIITAPGCARRTGKTQKRNGNRKTVSSASLTKPITAFPYVTGLEFNNG